MRDVEHERALRFQTVVRRQWADVADRLGFEPWRLIQSATGSRTGQLAVEAAGFSVGRSLRIVLDTPRPEPGQLRLHMEWEARSHAWLFPKMRAELLAASAGASSTRLELRGRYHPPAGILGLLVDRLVGHRVARAAVRGLLERLVRELEFGASSEASGRRRTHQGCTRGVDDHGRRGGPRRPQR